MNNPPFVSVIMNCRNSAEFLREAIDSVFAQSYKNWEIIFWDNQSIDNSPEIAQSYCEQSDNQTRALMRYFRAKHPTPLGEARNLAIANATGDLIAFLDCDDLWDSNKLAKQVDLFINNSALGLVCTNTKVLKDGKVISLMFDTAKPGKGKVFAELISSGWISMSSAVISVTALKSLDHLFDSDFNMAEEADLFYRIAYNWELDYVDEPLTSWRVHESNTTFAKFEQFALETRQILLKLQKLYPDIKHKYPELPALLERRAAFQAGVALWRQNKASEARKEISSYLNSLKFKAFWVLTWLPGSCFDVLARVYLKLPKCLRR